MDSMGDAPRDVDDLRDQIEAIILRGSEGFFDEAEDRTTLEVTTASPASSSMRWPCSASVSAIDVTICPK